MNTDLPAALEDDFAIVFSGLGCVGDGYDQERVAALGRIREKFLAEQLEGDRLQRCLGREQSIGSNQIGRIKSLEEQLDAMRLSLERIGDAAKHLDDPQARANIRYAVNRALSNPASEPSQEWVDEAWETSHPAKCPDCKGMGATDTETGVPCQRPSVSCEECFTCNGTGEVPSPASSHATTGTNRCDRPGCSSRATNPYSVGLGGMPAFYCAEHAPASRLGE